MGVAEPDVPGTGPTGVESAGASFVKCEMLRRSGSRCTGLYRIITPLGVRKYSPFPPGMGRNVAVDAEVGEEEAGFDDEAEVVGVVARALLVLVPAAVDEVLAPSADCEGGCALGVFGALASSAAEKEERPRRPSIESADADTLRAVSFGDDEALLSAPPPPALLPPAVFDCETLDGRGGTVINCDSLISISASVGGRLQLEPAPVMLVIASGLLLLLLLLRRGVARASLPRLDDDIVE